jgi:hypothetical protein
MSRSALFFGLYGFLLAGCAQLPAREGDFGQPARPGTAVDRLGDVTVTDLARDLPHALGRLGFLLECEERKTGRDLHFSTEWRQRAPFDDEVALGATAARTRLTLVARRNGVGYSTLHLYVENLLELEVGTWRQVPATESFGRYAREIGSELRLALVNRLRRF